MRHRDERIWVSAHLFYAQDRNKLLTKCIAPFIRDMMIEDTLENYFFVRYSESGPHIRLRLATSPVNEDHYREELMKRFQDFSKLHPSKIERITPVDEHSLADNSLHFVAYIPELARYGDEKTIGFAEAQFASSSKAVLKTLMKAAPNWNTASELILALKMHLAFFSSLGFDIQSIIKICKYFVDQWLPKLYDPTKLIHHERHQLLSKFEDRFKAYQDEILPAICDYHYGILNDGYLKDPLMNDYYLEGKQMMLSYESANFNLSNEPEIVTSFIHMTHNRIGIVNYDEAYIIYLLYRCLESIKFL
ncbi:thiopeptide-type bacteriocin biosynthesis protein [Pedobacter sp. CG_S7]|uniref:thiopeptide-type bacteriocin biosynthesis protein n=1 Tax=Pedobacter sp. CG_S7 TaxID=3143930 RepID=UPI003391B6AC